MRRHCIAGPTHEMCWLGAEPPPSDALPLSDVQASAGAVRVDVWWPHMGRRLVSSDLADRILAVLLDAARLVEGDDDIPRLSRILEHVPPALHWDARIAWRYYRLGDPSLISMADLDRTRLLAWLRAQRDQILRAAVALEQEDIAQAIVELGPVLDRLTRAAERMAQRRAA